MTTITLKDGQTATIDYEVLTTAGAAVNLTGLTVTLVITGRNGVKKNIVGVNDAPATLGTGGFPIVSADYDLDSGLRPAEYTFEAWLSSGDGPSDSQEPCLSGTLIVTAVPQRI